MSFRQGRQWQEARKGKQEQRAAIGHARGAQAQWAHKEVMPTRILSALGRGWRSGWCGGELWVRRLYLYGIGHDSLSLGGRRSDGFRDSVHGRRLVLVAGRQTGQSLASFPRDDAGTWKLAELDGRGECGSAARSMLGMRLGIRRKEPDEQAVAGEVGALQQT